MAIRTLRSDVGAATKSYYISNSTGEWVSVIQDSQGNYGLGNATMTGLSHNSAVEYSGGGTGWQCDVDDAIIITDTNGNLFWGGLPATRKRR